MKEFDKILQIPTEEEEEEEEEGDNREKQNYQLSTPVVASKSIARSSTENFLLVKDQSKANSGKGSVSPRFRRKTHSQVLKAASSIPSCKIIVGDCQSINTDLNPCIAVIFSNKSLKLNKSPANSYNFEQTREKFANAGKKNSIDDELFSIGSYKTRRSPLRALGNFVDDKIFRGRWSSTKRAKSTDEITWALQNEDLISNEISFFNDSNRKKSLGMLSFGGGSSSGEEVGKKQQLLKPSLSEKHKKTGGFRKMFEDNYSLKSTASESNPKQQQQQPPQQSRLNIIDVKKRKSSNPCTQSEMRSIEPFESLGGPGHCPNIRGSSSGAGGNEISADALAEIEVSQLWSYFTF